MSSERNCGTFWKRGLVARRFGCFVKVKMLRIALVMTEMKFDLIMLINLLSNYSP